MSMYFAKPLCSSLVSCPLQAMGIFGHMTAGMKGSEGSHPSETPSSSSPGVAVTELKDLEASLESLSKVIDESISPQALMEDREKQGKKLKTSEEPPHFTLASSPTRSRDGGPRKED